MHGCLNPPTTINIKNFGINSRAFWCPLCKFPKPQKKKIYNITIISKSQFNLITTHTRKKTNKKNKNKTHKKYLNAVEEFGIFVLRLYSIEGWKWHIIPAQSKPKREKQKTKKLIFFLGIETNLIRMIFCFVFWFFFLIPFAGFADLPCHPEIEEAIENKDESHIAVLSREKFYSGHFFSKKRINM